MIGTAAVQAAIVEILEGVTGLVDAGHVLSSPAADPAALGYPYIEIGDTQTLADDVVGRAGSEEFLTIHIWSKSGDAGEVKNIGGRIAAVFADQTVTVEGFGLVAVSVQSTRVLTDAYGFVFHGVLTLHIHAFA